MAEFLDSLTVEQLSALTAFRLTGVSQALANSTLTFTVNSNCTQIFTGATVGQIVKFPNATTLGLGHKFEIQNIGTATLSVQDGNAGSLGAVGTNASGYYTLMANGTVAGIWMQYQTYNTANGVVNYNLVSSTNFSTSSTTDVIITGFSVVPVAGTYGIWYNSQNGQTGAGTTNSCTIYNGASAITDSLRQTASPSGSHIFPNSTQTIATFNGTNACAVFVRVDSSTLTVQQRSLLMIRLGN